MMKRGCYDEDLDEDLDEELDEEKRMLLGKRRRGLGGREQIFNLASMEEGLFGTKMESILEGKGGGDEIF